MGTRVSHRGLIVLFMAIFIVMMGFGIVLPVLQFYAREVGATPVQIGLLATSYAFMQFLFAPFWGALSDRIGRKPVFALGLLGYAVSFIIFGLSHQVWELFMARILGGVLSAATLPTAMAYIGDATGEEDRGSGMGLMGAAMGLGFTIGPGIGGILGRLSLALPFFVGAGLALFTLALSWGALPEPARRGWSADRPSRIEAIRLALGGPLALFYIVTLVGAFALAGLEATYALFAQDRLRLSASGGAGAIGIVFVAVGLVQAGILGGVVGRLINTWGEDRLVRGGLVLAAVGYLLIVLTNNIATLAIYAAIAGTGHSLMRPSIASLISKRTPAGQGLSIGIMDSFDSLGRVIGPAWGGWVYHAGISLPYASAGLLLLLTAGVSVAAGTRGLPVQAP
ncbi:MAG: MFS transporter [Bacillati bacterium ANGP1]|uniref:MFS transporter n=1 Tax=Candidatus Segetimicrobium genomatis TaxID=2569760 RepID=A0A537J3B2_9BACT|nr:MAG: MFS transporter [Terrabacteria group bacterium ANGP1]